MVTGQPIAIRLCLLGCVLTSIAASAPVVARAAPAPIAARIDHDTPPVVGDVIVPQRQLFRCASADGARRSATSGFLTVDCERLREAGTWRVVACTRERLSHGGLVLVDIVAADGRRAWIPLPWHDWA